MTIFDNYFPLGLGTSRFPVTGSKDTAGIEKSVQLVLNALDSGINYIDTALQYSSGAAPDILKMAFAQTKMAYDVTVKVSYGLDKTADDTRARVEQSLTAMGIQYAKFFVCWTIFTYAEFEKVMSTSGIYDGAIKLKDEGIIDHICCSLHTPPDDSIKIIESGAFEGVTVSYSPLHAVLMQPVLESANKHNVGVAVMNPLGGGIIPQNNDYFSFIKSDDDTSTAVAALRFAKAHPAVNIVLSGLTDAAELAENISAFNDISSEPNEKRLVRVLGKVKDLEGFCTGCNYCDGCPKGIKVSHFMQARNALLFDPVSAYNRTAPDELLYNIQLFRKLQLEFGHLLETSENQCIGCGLCETKCTQKLVIINALQDIFNRAEKAGFSLKARKERLKELIVGKDYKRIGLYPNGGFANAVMELYNKCFGEPDFEWVQFNSDEKMHGKISGGVRISSPDEIEVLKPDLIIVTTYRVDDEICKSLERYEDVQVKKLHRDNDVPWIF